MNSYLERVGVAGKERKGFLPHSLSSKIEFGFVDISALKAFAGFVTDITNAPVVFSNPLYEITEVFGFGRDISDPELLRREGAFFTCTGHYRGLPAEIDFEVVEYIPDKVVVIESQRIDVKGLDLNGEVMIRAGWVFDSSNKEALLKAEIRFGLALRLLNKVRSIIPGQTEFDKGMEEAAKNIARGFKAVGN